VTALALGVVAGLPEQSALARRAADRRLGNGRVYGIFWLLGLMLAPRVVLPPDRS
jgi:hypothetical protein